jgi:hypothetical protein
MSATGPLSSSPLSDNDETDLRLERTVAAVDWNVLASLARSLHGTTSSRWGDQVSGGYNVVRFLHFDDPNHTVVVARVPYLPDSGWTGDYVNAFAPQMSSEVAIMRYLTAHTSIPVPHVIHYCVEADGGGVGSPYMILDKVDGVPLSSVWNDMDDANREIVLRMIVDILLELASHRFDKIGTIFQQRSDDATKQEWYVAPMVNSPYDAGVSNSVSSRTYTSAVDYWLTYANANLERIHDTNFGSKNKIYAYGHAWFMRSIIPALYDPSLDAAGFPICPGDFHSQNIMIVDSDSSPRITAVIDWECSGPYPTSSFAQYPLFIVDHPLWEDDNPLRQRNIRDQATFNMLMREAEMKKDPAGGLPLSRAFANCQGAYLFEQTLQYPDMFSALYPQLFEYVYGGEHDFSTDYYWALTENGILRKEAQQFDKETEVWKEAFETLGEELVSRSISREEFGAVVRKYVERFSDGGLVSKWLAT